MSTRIRRSARAAEDLLDIWDYVAVDNPLAADRVLDRLDQACARLVDHPQIGPRRPDIAADCRALLSGDYLILYRVIYPRDGATEVEIVRIVRGARDLGRVW